MNDETDHPALPLIIAELAEHGWARQRDVLPQVLTAALAQECRRRFAAGELAPAGVGRGAGFEVREGVRGDFTQWLEPGQAPCCDQYLALMDALRQQLNRELYLGLESFECHFALYPPGAFYKRHLDRFRDDDRRTVSVITYLNEAWQPADGGALRLYLGEPERAEDLAPHGGSLAAFLSADVPHEVLPAQRERLSLTGWFRRRGEGAL